ncbi:unnamed protein product [Nesidiocoris tenuis]|uniref:Uncharacterized protein n=1 Tax=Nesidiocoris tenuis TaxID=355587 RepID=A0A6H5HEN7_9HEMI|nr:unnamed protein product [Nesidiocoris tenuis]
MVCIVEFHFHHVLIALKLKIGSKVQIEYLFTSTQNHSLKCWCVHASDQSIIRKRKTIPSQSHGRMSWFVEMESVRGNGAGSGTYWAGVGEDTELRLRRMRRWNGVTPVPMLQASFAECNS